MSTQHFVHKVFVPGLPGDGFTPAEASSMRADVADVVADNILAKGREFDVKAYGAVGDGVTDDTAAIQAAADAIPGNNGSSAGATLVFPYGSYVISSTITVNSPGVTIRGAGPYTAIIRPTAAVTGPALRVKDATYALRGMVMENIVVSIGSGVACDGIEVLGAYDQVTLRNVFVTGIKGSARGISILPNPASAMDISQTLLAENCWVNGDRTAGYNGVCWDIENLQEATFIGCKGIGGGEGLAGGFGTSYRVRGSKGIVFLGCSAGLSTNGWHIAPSSDRGCDTITIDTPTIEGVQTPVNAVGTATYPNSNITFRSPRRLSGLGVIPGGSGAIALTYVNTSELDTRSIPLTINSTCTYIRATVFNLADVTDNGYRSMITETPNANNGGQVSHRAVGGFNFSDGTTNQMRLIPTTTITETPMILLAWTGSAWATYRVQVGPNNSGGTGFRALRITNGTGT